MAAKKKKTLTESLEALGAQRLAELLAELAEGDAPTRRRLKLELAVRESPKRVAAQVRKRLALIGRARSFVDWHKVRSLAADLEMQRRAIVDQVAKIDAVEALDLMWRFMELAGPVQNRSNDSNNELGKVFGTACRDLGPLASAAKADPLTLADQIFEAFGDNGYGQHDGLIATLAPVLGGAGLDRLKARFVELSRKPVAPLPQERRTVIGWGFGRQLYQDEISASSHSATVRRALQEIAEVQGDVDGYVAQYNAAERKVPGIAAEIARRLLAAGRAQDALGALDAATGHGQGVWTNFEWEDARIDVLDALGRDADAQAARWSCFERGLSARHLRAWLDRLPDFEDDEAERRALDHVERRNDVSQALAFLVSWKALDRAARLVIARARDLDGDRYEILTPAALALADEQPLAATLLLRAMVDFTLTETRVGRYRHAARHLTECASLAAAIPTFAPFESHEAWAARLKSQHGRKWRFWAETVSLRKDL